jgi:hypothetical protein
MMLRKKKKNLRPTDSNANVKLHTKSYGTTTFFGRKLLNYKILFILFWGTSAQFAGTSLIGRPLYKENKQQKQI